LSYINFQKEEEKPNRVRWKRTNPSTGNVSELKRMRK